MPPTCFSCRTQAGRIQLVATSVACLVGSLFCVVAIFRCASVTQQCSDVICLRELWHYLNAHAQRNRGVYPIDLQGADLMKGLTCECRTLVESSGMIYRQPEKDNDDDEVMLVLTSSGITWELTKRGVIRRAILK